jgi:hypothetical protein
MISSFLSTLHKKAIDAVKIFNILRKTKKINITFFLIFLASWDSPWQEPVIRCGGILATKPEFVNFQGAQESTPTAYVA